MATHYGVKVKYMSKTQMGDFPGIGKDRPHQNVVMKVSKLDYMSIRYFAEILEQEPKDKGGRLYLFLDGVTDPQNFGSILRSAMFLGADGVIVNKKDACGLTPTVSKVSSGALEFMPLYSVKFVGKFLEDIKRTHGFEVISTDIEGSIVKDSGEADEVEGEDGHSGPVTSPLLPLSDLQLDANSDVLLVLGSEGAGVS